MVVSAVERKTSLCGVAVKQHRWMSLKLVKRHGARLCSLAIAVGFAVWLALNWQGVLAAMGQVSVRLLLALTALQLISNLARTLAWETCVRAAGARTPRRPLHLASAANFLVGSFAPAHLGPGARVWMLSRYASDDGPSGGQMLAADAVGLFLQLVAATVCIPLLAADSDVSGVLKLALALALVFAAVCAFLLRARLARRAWAGPLRALGRPVKLAALFALNAGALAIQMLRTLLVMAAVGFHLSAIQAMLVFCLTTVTASPVPFGPGMSPVGDHAALRAHGALARAVGGGFVLGLSCALAALCYLVVTLTLSARARRLVPAPPEHTGSQTPFGFGAQTLPSSSVDAVAPLPFSNSPA